jgi:flagellar hook-length control protein FliK
MALQRPVDGRTTRSVADPLAAAGAAQDRPMPANAMTPGSNTPAPAFNLAAGAPGPLIQTSGTVPTAPSQATLTSSVESRDFAPALGSQVALWVRDGVQEARLHLHPAELGPVSVQIALDGTTARVDFHAPHAQTRAAIEESMPALAVALRESGMTLSGGGVFGQSAGDRGARSPDGQPERGNGETPIATAGAATRDKPVPRVWRSGLLDVFA